jgi:3-oxoadipate enol-lactonase
VHVIEGQGETIIFVHGNASTHETWTSVIRHLRSQFRCVSYDLRGHGGGPLPPGSLSLQEFVRDLETLRAELDLDRAYVVGHSLGAFIAAAYIARYPERVPAACLLAAPAARTEASREATRLLIEKLRTDGVASTMANLVPLWYTEEFVSMQPDVLRSRLAQIANIDDDAFLRTYEFYASLEIEPRLEEIKTPTLVMTGELAHGAGAAAAQSIAGQLASSKLVIFKGLKNGILTEIPDRVADELIRFFRRYRSRS